MRGVGINMRIAMVVLGGGGGVDQRENRGVTDVGYGVSDGLENRCRQEGGRPWQ